MKTESADASGVIERITPSDLPSMVYINKSGTGYLIVVSDAVSTNRLAVTKDELGRIVAAAKSLLPADTRSQEAEAEGGG